MQTNHVFTWYPVAVNASTTSSICPLKTLITSSDSLTIYLRDTASFCCAPSRHNSGAKRRGGWRGTRHLTDISQGAERKETTDSAATVISFPFNHHGKPTSLCQGRFLSPHDNMNCIKTRWVIMISPTTGVMQTELDSTTTSDSWLS